MLDAAPYLFTPYLLHLYRLLPRQTGGPQLRHAREILATTPIVDTHIDFPWHLVEHKKWYAPGYTAFALNNPEGDFDFERARQGGLYGPFMSIYIPAHYQKEPGRAKQVADSLIDMVYAIVRDYPDRFALAPRAADVVANFKKGIIALPMGMENGAPMEKIEDVAYFHQRGIRYVTLAHSLDNLISDSSYDTLHTNGGLSDYGREIVREMNRLGIMVDASHLSDEAIWDVLEVARKPLIATHSGCRHFTPDFERNLPDTLLRAIARTNGVVQVPFSQLFLGEKVRQAWRAAGKEQDAQKIPDSSPEAEAFYCDYGQRNGEPFWISVREVADHIDHIKNLVGIDYVGLGSDFDGVGLALPPDLADVSMYPHLLAGVCGAAIRTAISARFAAKMCCGCGGRMNRDQEKNLVHHPGAEISQSAHKRKLKNRPFPTARFAAYHGQGAEALHSQGVKYQQRQRRGQGVHRPRGLVAIGFFAHFRARMVFAAFSVRSLMSASAEPRLYNTARVPVNTSRAAKEVNRAMLIFQS